MIYHAFSFRAYGYAHFEHAGAFVGATGIYHLFNTAQSSIGRNLTTGALDEPLITTTNLARLIGNQLHRSNRSIQISDLAGWPGSTLPF